MIQLLIQMTDFSFIILKLHNCVYPIVSSQQNSPITLIQLSCSFNPTRSTGWRYNLQSPDDLSWILDEMGFLCQYLVYNSLLNPNHMFSKVLPCGLCWAVSGKYPLAYLGYNQRLVPSIGNIEKAMWVFKCLRIPGCF